MRTYIQIFKFYIRTLQQVNTACAYYVCTYLLIRMYLCIYKFISNPINIIHTYVHTHMYINIFPARFGRYNCILVHMYILVMAYKITTQVDTYVQTCTSTYVCRHYCE